MEILRKQNTTGTLDGRQEILRNERSPGPAEPCDAGIYILDLYMPGDTTALAVKKKANKVS
nr:MAG TPA: hypothetical protein [Microviridae sp.]